MVSTKCSKFCAKGYSPIFEEYLEVAEGFNEENAQGCAMLQNRLWEGGRCVAAMRECFLFALNIFSV